MWILCLSYSLQFPQPTSAMLQYHFPSQALASCWRKKLESGEKIWLEDFTETDFDT